jgi:hypothetical protein
MLRDPKYFSDKDRLDQPTPMAQPAVSAEHK